MSLRALQGPTGGGTPVGGSGTSSPSTIPRWTGPSTLGDSGLIDNGTAIYTTTRNVGIGTASPNKKFQVLDGATGEVRFTTTANVAGNTITQRFSSNAVAGAYEGGGAYIQAIQGAGIDIWSLAFGTANVSATAQERARIDSNGNIYGTSGTTGMTNGFFYIPAAAGAPTGVPTAVAGRVPMYYDTTNNQFYVYNGAWKKVTLA